MLNNQTEHNLFLKGDIARELDYYRIRETISTLCASEEGKDSLLQREPSYNLQDVDNLKKLGSEWNVYLHSSFPKNLSPWPPIAPIIPILKIEGASLLQENVLALGLFTISSAKIKDSIISAADTIPIQDLLSLVVGIPTLDEANRLIYSIIDETGEIKDLPVLREIRKRISSLTKEVENAIRKYTSDSSLNNVLQSNVPAYRSDRQVLAVRADKRSSIHGIVHEVSASGQTVYIEPDEVVKASNDLVQAEYELDAEIRKILKNLTSELAVYQDDFFSALEKMILLDTTYAAARYQDEIHGIFAEQCDLSKEPPVIYKARHPLLGTKAVPVDIRFIDGKRVLIITGPNTGGKTVTLKTIALFALLNQSGFPIPAAEGTRIPLFSSVFADIGDEQSIDQSLSTFSSHMKNIANLLNNADDMSLILLDELGSGTDPQEGGAIGMAVLDSLIKKNSFVLVTTHHGVLKNYGWTHNTCINASVEFDDSTLTPTYRLLMGIPGESHAVDIARRSGLPEEVINDARNYITTEQADVSSLIKGLTKKHAELDELQRLENERAEDLEQKSFKLQEKELRLKERDIELKEMEHNKSTAFLVETRSKLENLVRTLREGEITREKTVSVKQFINELTDQVDNQNKSLLSEYEILEKERNLISQEEERLTQNGIRISSIGNRKSSSKKNSKSHLSNKEAFKNAEPIKIQDFQKTKKIKKEQPTKILFAPGVEVLAGAARRPGILISEYKKGMWSVQFGSMKMNVPQTQLIPVKDNSKHQSPSVIIESSDNSGETSERPAFELRLLGMRCEEAIRVLQRQLDLCAIHNFNKFSIIHGKGTGILQQAVQDFLAHYPGVKSYSFASPEDGGTGKTYVTLF